MPARWQKALAKKCLIMGKNRQTLESITYLAMHYTTCYVLWRNSTCDWFKSVRHCT